MNTSKTIAIIIILLFVNGLIASVYDGSGEDITSLANDIVFQQQEDLEQQLSEYEKTIEEQGVVDQLITTAGNTVSMGLQLVKILFKGMTSSYTIYQDTAQYTGTERLIGIFAVSIISLIMPLLIILLIYDKLKNRKQD